MYLVFGEMIEVELCEGGAQMMLTKENREQFVNLYVEYYLNKSIQDQFDAFRYQSIS
jgi:hypothetical protein